MKNIVILGAGYGGLKAAVELQKRISNSDCKITLINKNNYHYESTWLHEVSAGSIEGNEASYDIHPLLDDSKVEFKKGTVLEIKSEENIVVLENEEISFDYLVVALGFESDDFNTKGVKEYCFPITNRHRAILINKKIEEELLRLKESNDKEKKLVISVIGAGFSGIELLGEFTEQLPRYLKDNNLEENQIVIQNVHPGKTILPNFDPKLVSYATNRLESKGIHFYHGYFMTEATENSIFVEKDGERRELPSDITIWTAGVKGNSVISKSNIPNRKDRVSVNEFLQLPTNENVFVIGDCSVVFDKATNSPLPPTAQIAIQQGICVAKSISNLIQDGKPLEFKYDHKGTVCSLGEKTAIGTAFGVNIKGMPAAFLKKAIDDRSLFMLGGLKTVFKKGKF